MTKAIWVIFILSAVVVYLIAYNSGETSAKRQSFFFSKNDEECFKSPNLRVQIGDMNLVIPRAQIYTMGIIDDKIPNAQTFCQFEKDAPVKLIQIGFKMVPLICDDKSDCNGKMMLVTITDLGIYSGDFVSYYEPTFARRCTHLGEVFKTYLSEWHEKYGDTCNIDFRKENIVYELQFRPGPYPPEKIDQTKELALQYINDNLIVQSSINIPEK